MPSPVEFVLAVAKSLADQPDRVSARWVEGERGGHVELLVAEGDRGKMIGRRGQTVEAMRRLVQAAFAGEGQAFGVELKDE